MSYPTGSNPESNPYQPPRMPDSAFAGATPPDASGTPKVAEMLRQTRPWVRFLSILGFIGSGLMVLGGCLGGLGSLAFARAGNPQALLMLVYIPLSLIYLMPSLFLHRYANHISDFLVSRRGDQLESALEAQKSFWRFVGITAAVVMVIYAVVLVVALVIGVIRAAAR